MFGDVPPDEKMFETQQQSLENLLKSFGVPYELEKYEASDKPDENYPGATVFVKISAPDHLSRKPDDKVTGYGGFETNFAFNAQGQFVKMGIWE